MSRMLSGVAVTGGTSMDIGDVQLDKTGQSGRGMQYTGVGISIEFKEDRVIVAQAFEGGPAHALGLTRGTAITSVNGRPISELNPNQVVQLIRGEPGSEVVLDIIEPGGSLPETIRVQRGEVTAPGR